MLEITTSIFVSYAEHMYCVSMWLLDSMQFRSRYLFARSKQNRIEKTAGKGIFNEEDEKLPAFLTLMFNIISPLTFCFKGQLGQANE